jgi:putative phage-type endonuclease
VFETEVMDAPEQGTDEWLAWRKQGITATEAAVIMHPTYGRSAMRVYTDKLGITEQDQSDEKGYFEWGHILEDDLVEKFMKSHPEFTDFTTGRLYQRDWCKCSLDAQCYDEFGEPVIVECKSGQRIDKWNPIPQNYFAQIQWQMYVTGIRRGFFAVIIAEDGWHYFEKEVEYNPAFVKKMLEKCFVVWDCIQNKQPPATLGINAADKDAIAAMAGMTGHSGPAVSVDAETIAKFKELKEAAEKADEEFTKFKNELGYKMIDASRLLTPEGKSFASWVERKGQTTVDKVKLQSKYPDIYNECLKTGMGSRYVKYTV